MRVQFFIVALMAALAVVAIPLLAPGPRELAYQYYRDNQLVKARTLYEEEVRLNKIGAADIVPLTRIYIASGLIDDAILLLEGFLEENPKDLLARAFVTDLYRQDQRIWDYQRSLEQLTLLDDNPDRLRELLSLYRRQAVLEEQTALLKRLVEAEVATPQDLRDLAWIQARGGDLAGASATLDLLAERFSFDSEEFDSDVVVLQINLLLDQGRIDEAAARAAAWLQANREPRTAETLAELFSAAGQPERALALLDPYRDELERQPALLTTVAQLLIDLDRREEALALLDAAWQDGRLSPASAQLLIEQSLTSDLNRSVAVLETQDPAYLPAWLIGAVTQRVLDEEEGAGGDQNEVAARLLGQLGETWLVDNPVTAAELALAADLEARALSYALEAADTLAGRSADQLVRLATVLQRLDRQNNAMEVLAALARQEDVPPEIYRGLANLYVALGQVDSGLALYAQLRADRPEAAGLAAGWALLAAAAGRADEVEGWLAVQKVGSLDRQLLLDLHFIARDRRAWLLALAAGERLLLREDDAESLLRLAETLVSAGAPDAQGRVADARFERVPQLITVDRDGGGRARAVRALRQGGLEALAAALAGEPLPPAPPAMPEPPLRRADALAAAGEASRALPLIRERLGADPLALPAYVAALYAATPGGAAPAQLLAARWQRVLEDRAAGEEARSQAIFALLALGAGSEAWAQVRARAEGGDLDWLYVLADLARASRRGDDVARLADDQLQDEGLSREAREARIFLIQEFAGDAAALPHIRQASARYGQPWTDALDAALTRLGRTEELAGLLAARGRDPRLGREERLAVAFRLLELGEKRVAEEILLAAAAGAPPDDPAVSQLLFIWGPRPRDSQLDWLEARGASATGAERAAWMDLLTDRGAGRRAASLCSLDRCMAGVSLQTAWVRALSSVQARRELAELVGLAAQAGGPPPVMIRWGDLAYEQGLWESAMRAYETAAREGGDPAPEVMERLGKAAVFAEDRQTARLWLTRYLDLRAGDSESNYLLAELLRAERREGAAQTYYRRALAAIETIAQPSYVMRRNHAIILGRLGRLREARPRFEALIAERPADTTTRTDYATLLLDFGEPVEADRVLNGRGAPRRQRDGATPPPPPEPPRNFADVPISAIPKAAWRQVAEGQR